MSLCSKTRRDISDDCLRADRAASTTEGTACAKAASSGPDANKAKARRAETALAPQVDEARR